MGSPENHHTAIIDRALFEKANEMHPKKKRSVAESRTNFTLERRKNSRHCCYVLTAGILAKRNRAFAECSDARTNGDPVSKPGAPAGNCWRKISLGLSISMQRQCWKRKENIFQKGNANKEINTAELQKQSRQLTSER